MVFDEVLFCDYLFTCHGMLIMCLRRVVFHLFYTFLVIFLSFSYDVSLKKAVR